MTDNSATRQDQQAEQRQMLRAFGQTPADVQARLERELDAFERAVAAVQPHWHTTLPQRAWTAAQESDHIIRVNAGTARIAALLLSDKPLRPTDQTPGVMVDGKRKAPAGLEPGPDQAWDALSGAHAQTRAALLQAAAHAPETSDRTYFHPYMGELTALEWLKMATLHMRHHRKQLERLAQG
ncbi:DinB family protein [Deinococcus sp. Arct2-2]|uniref:DinB family protein n=1 Tax=Deinococcus sp. Arct2-2 TaxID=2568653 RepID=UPI0010A4BBA2|nr:DinB family protein [Deinococcus sp. Arct2-2]THF70104.1 DinB family protein [Deinococcus sp. Arct2-2]